MGIHFLLTLNYNSNYELRNQSFDNLQMMIAYYEQHFNLIREIIDQIQMTSFNGLYVESSQN